MWGSQKCISMYVWVSKLPFFVMWDLEIQFFVCGCPENAKFCGFLKKAFSCKWGLENSVFCVCGLENAIFVCGDLEKYFYVEVLENSISGIWGLENAFLVCGGIKMPCPPFLMSTGDSH